MNASLEKPAEVLAVSSDTKEDTVALEKVVERVVEDVVGEAFAPQKVVSPRTSTGTVTLESGEDPLAEETQSQVLSAANVMYLPNRLEASRTAYNAESQRVDKVTAASEKK
ncbi:hypothetical protein AXG93_773s1820 [Marchantia polymorpha subsp. ruderalis]|uniref:Uncharacterized protein n=1 Tax=Marchantia polymorpha subsp. ruderalis TaxID=1480154 RepID=A0A176WBD3_MARPO|nr:hypothetical protein AXG93_773s1820 [Marchantia polymorpha subsp. ruderalis]